MANGPERADFWRRFIGERCHYPAPERLRAQLTVAEFSDFCPCGCNSFAVNIPQSAEVEPLAVPSGRGGMVFEADFNLPAGQTLEILLFVGEDGNLAYVEIDCLANTSPVPDEITVEVEEAPFNIYASDKLITSGED